ncbi:HAMP domain-containing sensor histidine kinase [Neomegalonema sp.]|uniref:sensor histidine kinase n=1 Tax=Neomegalonema sp. TaxID=2039713 RepID=UPI0026355652|nr:HAMP domain-containing sensor histidine kinase [Neomegalonema sp.]MDD2869236.1 HAMP domain-containing sensor histidine kinase [Neomegalonema sp.]
MRLNAGESGRNRDRRRDWGISALVAALVALPAGALTLLGLWFAEAERAVSLQTRRQTAQAEAQAQAGAVMEGLEAETRRLAESVGAAFRAEGSDGLRRAYLTEPVIAAVALFGPALERLFPAGQEALLFGEDRLMRQAAPRLDSLRAEALRMGSAWSGTPREAAAPALHCRKAPPGVVCLLLRPEALAELAARLAAPARLVDLEAPQESGAEERAFGLLPAPFAGFALAREAPPAPSRSPFALALLLAPTLLGSAAAGLFALRAHRLKLKAARVRLDALAEVSHDLRTPLANLRLYADLLRRAEGRPEKIARCATVIEEETIRLSRLVEGALTAFVAEAPPPPAPETHSPDALVRALLERYGPSFGGAPVLDLRSPELARFDARAFERVLLNLLDNARKYAPGAVVEIATRRAPGEIRLIVSDAGPGAGSRSPSPEGAGGFGLGLKACAALARQAGGEFAAEIAPEGARFALSLPAFPGGPS